MVTKRSSLTPQRAEQRVADEWQAMHIALGKILNGWALIENQLATLMGVILQNSVGLVIYHCSNNFETRLKNRRPVASDSPYVCISGPGIYPVLGLDTKV